MKNSYFYLVWRHNRFLFIIIIGFVLGQAFFTYKAVENTPFFHYGMYSEPCEVADTYSTVVLYQEEKRLSAYDLVAAPSFLQYQLRYYAKLIAQDSVDYVQMTIENRFGKQSAFSNYLIPFLTNSELSLPTVNGFFSALSGYENLSIRRENYKWVKNKFVLVNYKRL